MNRAGHHAPDDHNTGKVTAFEDYSWNQHSGLVIEVAHWIVRPVIGNDSFAACDAELASAWIKEIPCASVLLNQHARPTSAANTHQIFCGITVFRLGLEIHILSMPVEVIIEVCWARPLLRAAPTGVVDQNRGNGEVVGEGGAGDGGWGVDCDGAAGWGAEVGAGG